MAEKNDMSDLVESLGQLWEMQKDDNNHKAAELYRAMFRHDMDLNKLDFNYADHILDYVMFGHDIAMTSP